MILYKLTDENDVSGGLFNTPCKWGEGITHSGTGEPAGKGTLCGPGYIYAYTSPELAVLINPIHLSLKQYHMWEAEGEIALNDFGLKVGCVSLTTLRRIEPPVATPEIRTRFSILCALNVYDNPKFGAWADDWLSGRDRSELRARAMSAEASHESLGVWGTELGRGDGQLAAREAAAANSAAWAARSAAMLVITTSEYDAAAAASFAADAAAMDVKDASEASKAVMDALWAEAARQAFEGDEG